MAPKKLTRGKSAKGRRQERNGERAPEGRVKRPSVLRMGGPRTEFGTRISRRIECARCGREDHVPYVPRERDKALCRECAAEVLRAFEEGVRAKTPTRPATCNLCGTPFELPITAFDDGDLLCPPCLRGWTAWQGSLEVPYEERKHAVLESHRAGTKLRRRKKPRPGASPEETGRAQ